MLVQRVVKTLAAQGHNVTVAATTGPETAGAIAREHIARGADLVVAAGGDGTINEVAEGMVCTGVPLAILPGGTANVLAMEMKLGKNMEKVAAHLHKFQPRRIPIGHVCCDGGRVSRHFLLMAGIGLDARIVYAVDGNLKAQAGKLAYWVAGWSLLGRRLPCFRVEVEGEAREYSFALVSKVRNYGGDFEIARDVRLFDDTFEVVLFEGRSTLRYVKYFFGLALHRLEDMKGVTVLRSDHIQLGCPSDRQVYVQVDGEFAGRLPAEVRMVKNGITLLVPDWYGA